MIQRAGFPQKRFCTKHRKYRVGLVVLAGFCEAEGRCRGCDLCLIGFWCMPVNGAHALRAHARAHARTHARTHQGKRWGVCGGLCSSNGSCTSGLPGMGGGKAATRHGPLKPHYQGHFRPISAAAGTAEGAKERKTISLKLANHKRSW